MVLVIPYLLAYLSHVVAVYIIESVIVPLILLDFFVLFIGFVCIKSIENLVNNFPHRMSQYGAWPCAETVYSCDSTGHGHVLRLYRFQGSLLCYL